MDKLFAEQNFDGVIHFAGLKALWPGAREQAFEPLFCGSESLWELLKRCSELVKTGLDHESERNSLKSSVCEQSQLVRAASSCVTKDAYSRTKQAGCSCRLLLKDAYNAGPS